jgi:GH15 family glucan-1,4-alpha-glucosidase
MIGITITTGRTMTENELAQVIAGLEARAVLAEHNGLPKTARSWRAVIENLQKSAPAV